MIFNDISISVYWLWKHSAFGCIYICIQILNFLFVMLQEPIMFRGLYHKPANSRGEMSGQGRNFGIWRAIPAILLLWIAELYTVHVQWWFHIIAVLKIRIICLACALGKSCKQLYLLWLPDPRNLLENALLSGFQSFHRVFKSIE